ncbi:MAG: hypothetical protein H7237_07335 [Alkalinema sp. FL-bin-369]|nr:hypothetical protein [Leptolyngbyaceae cyanobacterium LF-bin-369]
MSRRCNVPATRSSLLNRFTRSPITSAKSAIDSNLMTRDINNPKIPLKSVLENGELLYSIEQI